MLIVIWQLRMPKQVTQYNIFLGSPGGLDDERKEFRSALERCSLHYGSVKDIRFHPVGWEDAVGGAGRPQNQINEALLKECDYAVFVLHDRWGTPTGSGHASGVEEEWFVAEKLYADLKIQNIALFFKKVDPGKLNDPGPQLRNVLSFKQKIEDEKRHFYKEYADPHEFSKLLDAFLAKCLNHHTAGRDDLATSDPATIDSSGDAAPVATPNFGYWLAEAFASQDSSGSLFCASKALNVARTIEEWGRAKHLWAEAQFRLGRIGEAAAGFIALAETLRDADEPPLMELCASALFNWGIALRALGRSESVIPVCDQLVARFGCREELSLQKWVAMSLVSKGIALGELGRGTEEIEVCNEIVGRFGSAQQAVLRLQVANALVNKGVALVLLGYPSDAIAVFDDVLVRFAFAMELPLREAVAKAALNKGVALLEAGQRAEAIAAFIDVQKRYGTAPEVVLHEVVTHAVRLRQGLEMP